LVQALEIYKSAIDGNDSIQTFYGHIKNLDGNVSRMLQFPELSPPPEDFLVQMEEYIASAPVDASMDYSPSRNAGAQSRARQVLFAPSTIIPIVTVPAFCL
jgi:hypothetical protein